MSIESIDRIIQVGTLPVVDTTLISNLNGSIRDYQRSRNEIRVTTEIASNKIGWSHCGLLLYKRERERAHVYAPVRLLLLGPSLCAVSV